MEFSCVYFHSNRQSFYIIFARNDNLIYINLMDEFRVVITIDMLFQDYLLAGYYLLSLCLTENVHNLTYFEDGTWGEQVLCNWCIASKVIWKLCGITNTFPNTAGFTSDPRLWIFKKSTTKKIEKFFSVLYDTSYFQNYYHEQCPYATMDFYISNEVDLIDIELKSIEEYTNKADFTIKTIALLTSNKFAYSLPHDIMQLCF